MKWLLVIVPVIASALWLADRKRNSRQDTPTTMPEPESESPLELELRERMEEFLRRDCFSLVVQPVVDFRTNMEQNRFVREAGCHYGQGFLFFKPTDQNQVLEMIHKSSILEETA